MDGRAFRVAPVPVTQAPPFARSPTPALLFALAPSSAKPSAKVGVQIASGGGLPAGSAVELFVLGDNFVDTPNNAGDAVVVATGHVSADGKTIATDPGEGIQLLTWIGVRKKGN